MLFTNQTVGQFSYFSNSVDLNNIGYKSPLWTDISCLHTPQFLQPCCVQAAECLSSSFSICLRPSHLSLGSRESVYRRKRVWKRLWLSKMRSLLWLTGPKHHFFHRNPNSPVHCMGTGHVSIWGPLSSSRNVCHQQHKANSNQEDKCTCFLSSNRAAEHPDVCSCGWFEIFFIYFSQELTVLISSDHTILTSCLRGLQYPFHLFCLCQRSSLYIYFKIKLVYVLFFFFFVLTLNFKVSG